MQVVFHHGGCQEVADTLEQSAVLSVAKHGGLWMHTLERDGQTVLMFTDSNNNAITVQAPGESPTKLARLMRSQSGRSVSLCLAAG